MPSNLFSHNPHVLTILGNFWPQELRLSPFPAESRFVRTDPDTQVLVQTQRPVVRPIGEVVMIHGLEGHGERRLRSQHGLRRASGWVYRSSLSYADVWRRYDRAQQDALPRGPDFGSASIPGSGARRPSGISRVSSSHISGQGFRWAGTCRSKLAGELGEAHSTDLIAGVCAISTPIDLAAGVRRIGQRRNRLYERRFLKRMRERLLATGRYSQRELAAAPDDLSDRRPLYRTLLRFQGRRSLLCNAIGAKLSGSNPRANPANSGKRRYFHSV